MRDNDKTKKELIKELSELRKELAELRNTKKAAGHKDAAHTLRQSENQLRDLIDCAADAIYIINLSNNRITDCNRQACLSLGYTREEILKLSTTDIEIERGVDVIRAVHADVCRGMTAHVQGTHRRKDGSLFPVDIRLARLGTPGSELSMAIVRDISVMKKAEEALLESEKAFHNLFNNSEVAMFRTRLDGTGILNANEKFLELVGRSREEVIGQPSAIYWVDPGRRETMVDMLKARGRVVDFEFQLLSKESGVRDCLTSLNYHPAEGILDGSILDITERKRQEKAIIRASKEWRRTFDSVPDLVALLDTEYRISRLNKAMARRLGTIPQKLVGRRCYEVIHGTSAPPDYCPHSRLLRSGKDEGSEIKVERLGGLFEVRTTPVHNDTGELVGSVHIMRDITEHRRLEEQLRQAMKLEGIGQLAGGMAHDFNNVLNAVIGYAALLQMRVDEADPIRLFVDEIVEAGKRGADLTRQILTFSRKQMLCMCPVDLNEVISGIQNMLRRLVREDIEMEINLCSRPLVLMADTGQITQVLINLATNAADAMPDSGKLRISTEVSAIDSDHIGNYDVDAPGDYALLIVSDSGTGMHKETMSHLFDPFFTTKGVGKGTGLGLSVVHGIVKQHRGHIDVDSEVGKGTIFKIYLPLTEHRAEKLKDQTTNHVWGGTETILIAEDEAPLRKLSAAVLKHYGYTLITAVDGEDAVQKYKENQEAINLVILDAIMPKKNGKEVYEAMKGIRPRVKAIFLSGYTEDIFSPADISEQDVIFLTKPIMPDNLAKKVREALDR